MKYPKDFINKIICGDCLEVMKEMPGGCVDMVITSPPYWGFRDYDIEQIFGGDPGCEHEWIDKTIIRCTPGDRPSERSLIAKNRPNETVNRPNIKQNICSKCHAWKGQLGLEPTPEFYIEHLTEIFSEVKRILKKGGTLWLNLGDTYATTSGRQGKSDLYGKQPKFSKNADKSMPVQWKIDLPQKCLCMIPERIAWSLIQDGWILRNKNIWYKPNSMPSSVKDRFSNRWEYVFMFSKSQRYYFDLDAVREPHATRENRPFGIVRNREWGYDSKENLLRKTKIPKESSESHGSPRARYHRKWEDVPGQETQSIENHSGYFDKDGNCLVNPLGKNPGDVFEWNKHDLNEPGKPRISTPWKSAGVPRTTHPKGRAPSDFWQINTQPFPEAHFAVFPEKLCEKPIRAGCPEGGILLDPFCGAGTALLVAKEMKRNYIGIDIKKEFCNMSERRLAQGVL